MAQWVEPIGLAKSRPGPDPGQSPRIPCEKGHQISEKNNSVRLKRIKKMNFSGP